jgi:NADH dehydrogenase (ubiquinone) 1 beta subcomplex subunit 8
MAGLVKLSKFAAKISNKSSLGLVIRTASHWNKDWKPGPYPKTQAEREAAAKKYGIPIEQYEPYPDDGMGFGDYPKLPDISVDRKDPNYPYDMPEMKRNFQDPIHVHVDVFSEDRWNNCKLNFYSRRHRSLKLLLNFQRVNVIRIRLCLAASWEL